METPKVDTLAAGVPGNEGNPGSWKFARVRAWGTGTSVRFLEDFGLLLVIVVICVAMSQASPVFLTSTNIINVLYQSTIIAVVAIGETFVILGRGIDLSVGSTLALSSVLSVGLWLNQGLPVWLAIVAALGSGVGVGLVNGFLVTKVKLSALIATLGTLSAVEGFSFVYSGGLNIAPVPHVLYSVGNAMILGVPVFIPFVAVMAVISHIVLTRSRLGRSVIAVGGNETAARLSGIRADRVIVTTFVIAGLCAAVGGLMTTARLASGSADAGSGMELTVIAAVVIGGTSLFGGEGSIAGTVLGVLLLALVQNAVNLLQVPANWDEIASGGIIVVAAGIDVYRRRYVAARLVRRRRQGAEKDEPRYAEPPKDGVTTESVKR